MDGTANIIRFEDVEIDLTRGELLRDGQAIDVEPQVLDLLTFLAENAGRLVTRDEILEEIWQGRIVSESAIASRISAARQAVGDDGKQQRIIKTVSRKGVMFLPEPEFAEAKGKSKNKVTESSCNIWPACFPMFHKGLLCLKVILSIYV